MNSPRCCILPTVFYVRNRKENPVQSSPMIPSQIGCLQIPKMRPESPAISCDAMCYAAAFRLPEHLILVSLLNNNSTDFLPVGRFHFLLNNSFVMLPLPAIQSSPRTFATAKDVCCRCEHGCVCWHVSQYSFCWARVRQSIYAVSPNTTHLPAAIFFS